MLHSLVRSALETVHVGCAVAAAACGQASLSGSVVVRPARSARTILHVRALGALGARTVTSALRAVGVLGADALGRSLLGLHICVLRVCIGAVAAAACG